MPFAINAAAWSSLESASADVQAVRLAAGELVLRIREEQRRRAIGNVCAASMQTRRMTGNKPGAPCSDASQHQGNLDCFWVTPAVLLTAAGDLPLDAWWLLAEATALACAWPVQQCLVETPLCSAVAIRASVAFFWRLSGSRNS